MQLRSTTKDWGAVAKFLHWAMALCIILMILQGITMRWFLGGNLALQFSVYQLHKSLGFTLLMFALTRLVWRLSAKTVPASSITGKPHEHWLANGVHIALYVAMIGMPVSGLLATSASALNIPTVIFGLFILPRPIGPNTALAAFFSGVHFWLAWLLVMSVMLHIAGAIWHKIVLRDGVFERMAPRGRGGSGTANQAMRP